MNIKDILYDYYKNSNQLVKKINIDLYKEKIQNKKILINHNHGIGDSMMLYLWESQINNKNNFQVKFNINVLNSLNSFNNYIPSIFNKTNKDLLIDELIDICEIQEKVDCNGGHFLQKIQLICDIPKQIIPKPFLTNNILTIPNLVVMSFDKGLCNQNSIHSRARLLYPEHKETIQKFIDNNISKYTFIEVGKTFSGLKNVIDKTNLGIENTTKIICECDYYFGMHNGLMHIAAGLGKKSIIIVNFPSAKDIILPCLSEVKSKELSWLYPQNIHLHEDDDGPFVKFLTYSSIEKSFNGEIYPFFSFEYLNN